MLQTPTNSTSTTTTRAPGTLGPVPPHDLLLCAVPEASPETPAEFRYLRPTSSSPSSTSLPSTTVFASAKSKLRAQLCDWTQVIDFDLVSYRITAYSELIFGVAKFQRWENLTEAVAKSHATKALKELDLSWHIMETEDGRRIVATNLRYVATVILRTDPLPLPKLMLKCGLWYSFDTRTFKAETMKARFSFLTTMIAQLATADSVQRPNKTPQKPCTCKHCEQKPEERTPTQVEWKPEPITEVAVVTDEGTLRVLADAAAVAQAPSMNTEPKTTDSHTETVVPHQAAANPIAPMIGDSTNDVAAGGKRDPSGNVCAVFPDLPYPVHHDRSRLRAAHSEARGERLETELSRQTTQSAVRVHPSPPRKWIWKDCSGEHAKLLCSRVKRKERQDSIARRVARGHENDDEAAVITRRETASTAQPNREAQTSAMPNTETAERALPAAAVAEIAKASKGTKRKTARVPFAGSQGISCKMTGRERNFEENRNEESTAKFAKPNPREKEDEN